MKPHNACDRHLSIPKIHLSAKFGPCLKQDEAKALTRLRMVDRLPPAQTQGLRSTKSALTKLSDALQQLALPLRDLVRMKVELLGQRLGSVLI